MPPTIPAAASVAAPRRRPIIVYQAMTFRCPRSCSYCLNPAWSESLDVPRFHGLLRDLARWNAERARRPAILTLTGGEPLCEPRCVELAVTAAGLGLETRIVSAGGPLAVSDAERLARAGVRLTLSLESARPEVQDGVRGRGAFRAAARLLEKASAAGCLAKTILMVTRASAPFLEESVRFVERAGVRDIVLQELSVADGPLQDAVHRLGAVELARLRATQPGIRFRRYRRCPKTFNVSPEGRRFVQHPPSPPQVLDADVALERALLEFVDAPGRWPQPRERDRRTSHA